MSNQVSSENNLKDPNFIQPVVAAIIFEGDSVLCAMRGDKFYHGFWEFPGGKVDPGEDNETALVREISEELGVHIQVIKPFHDNEHEYPHGRMHLYSYICEFVNDSLPKALEHLEIRYVPLNELNTLEWVPADVEIVKQLQNY